VWCGVVFLIPLNHNVDENGELIGATPHTASTSLSHPLSSRSSHPPPSSSSLPPASIPILRHSRVVHQYVYDLCSVLIFYLQLHALIWLQCYDFYPAQWRIQWRWTLVTVLDVTNLVLDSGGTGIASNRKGHTAVIILIGVASFIIYTCLMRLFYAGRAAGSVSEERSRVSYLTFQRLALLYAEFLIIPLMLLLMRVWQCGEDGAVTYMSTIHYGDDGEDDTDNDTIQCWSLSHVILLVIINVGVITAIATFTIVMYQRMKRGIVFHQPDTHEKYIQCRELEYLLGCSRLYEQTQFFYLSSFNRFWVWYRLLQLFQRVSLVFLLYVVRDSAGGSVGEHVQVQSALFLALISAPSVATICYRTYRCSTINAIKAIGDAVLFLTCVLNVLIADSRGYTSSFLDPDTFSNMMLFINLVAMAAILLIITYTHIKVATIGKETMEAAKDDTDQTAATAAAATSAFPSIDSDIDDSAVVSRPSFLTRLRHSLLGSVSDVGVDGGVGVCGGGLSLLWPVRPSDLLAIEAVAPMLLQTLNDGKRMMEEASEGQEEGIQSGQLLGVIGSIRQVLQAIKRHDGSGSGFPSSAPFSSSNTRHPYAALSPPTSHSHSSIHRPASSSVLSTLVALQPSLALNDTHQYQQNQGAANANANAASSRNGNAAMHGYPLSSSMPSPSFSSITSTTSVVPPYSLPALIHLGLTKSACLEWTLQDLVEDLSLIHNSLRIQTTNGQTLQQQQQQEEDGKEEEDRQRQQQHDPHSYPSSALCPIPFGFSSSLHGKFSSRRLVHPVKHDWLHRLLAMRAIIDRGNQNFVYGERPTFNTPNRHTRTTNNNNNHPMRNHTHTLLHQADRTVSDTHTGTTWTRQQQQQRQQHHAHGNDDDDDDDADDDDGHHQHNPPLHTSTRTPIQTMSFMHSNDHARTQQLEDEDEDEAGKSSIEMQQHQ